MIMTLSKKAKHNLKWIIPVLFVRVPIVFVLSIFIKLGEFCDYVYEWIDYEIPGIER